MSAAERVSRAAGTIRARWERGVEESPQVDAARALDDAGMLLDPDVAAELVKLRKRVVELEAAAAPRKCGRGLSTGKPCPDHPRAESVPVERVDAEALDKTRANLPLEEPHDSPLSHRYELGRDLPETGDAS